MTAHFKLLRNKRFLAYFVGQAISMSGSWMQGVVLSWLVYDLTHSGAWLGMVAFCTQVPAFVTSPFAGIVADRIERRKVLIAVQWGGLIQATLLAVLVLANRIQIWQIIVLSILQGLIQAFEMITRHAISADLVERRDLSSAIALNSFLINSTRIIGPGLAGFFILWVGVSGCFLLNALSFVPVIASLLWIKFNSRPPHTGQRPGALSQIFDSLRYVKTKPEISRLLLFATALSIFGCPAGVLLPVINAKILGGDQKTLGLLTSFAALGALAGSMNVPNWIGEESKRNRLLLKNLLLMGVALIVVGSSHWLPSTLMGLALVNYFMMVSFPCINSAIQLVVHDSMRGRILALYTMTFLGTAPLAGLLAGALADLMGVSPVLFLNGAICILATLGLLWALRGRILLDHPPLAE